MCINDSLTMVTVRDSIRLVSQVGVQVGWEACYKWMQTYLYGKLSSNSIMPRRRNRSFECRMPADKSRTKGTVTKDH